MPTKDHYFDQIDKEFATAREAMNAGNAGKARVCARRAAGQAISWFLTKHTRPSWGLDALSQLTHLKDDQVFPEEIRNAAIRLTTRISDRFTYPFTADPIEDAQLIIKHIEQLLKSDAG